MSHCPRRRAPWLLNSEASSPEAKGLTSPCSAECVVSRIAREALGPNLESSVLQMLPCQDKQRCIYPVLSAGQVTVNQQGAHQELTGWNEEGRERSSRFFPRTKLGIGLLVSSDVFTLQTPDGKLQAQNDDLPALTCKLSIAFRVSECGPDAISRAF